MIAPWFLLFLDPGRRLLLAGGGGEVTELLAEPTVNRERIENAVRGGERDIGAEFLQPHTRSGVRIGQSDRYIV